jgi:hypothetical protein
LSQTHNILNPNNWIKTYSDELYGYAMGFKNESNFTTWTYPIATNYLLNLIDKQKRQQINFEMFAVDLSQGLNHNLFGKRCREKIIGGGSQNRMFHWHVTMPRC